MFDVRIEFSKEERDDSDEIGATRDLCRSYRFRTQSRTKPNVVACTLGSRAPGGLWLLSRGLLSRVGAADKSVDCDKAGSDAAPEAPFPRIRRRT